VLYNHPVLSIFFTHRLHPFSKKHRLIVFLCSLSFAVCFAFILLGTPLVPTVSLYTDLRAKRTSFDYSWHILLVVMELINVIRIHTVPSVQVGVYLRVSHRRCASRFRCWQ
jgi:hypothetical protein